MKTAKPISAIFFDLGATLVEPQFTPAGAFSCFTALPGTREGLAKLSAAKLPIGIISNTGDIDPKAVRAALKKLKLLSFFAEKLILLSGEVHLDKSTPAIFRLAAKRAGAEAAAGTCIFVGEDPAERHTARQARLRTATSLALLLKTLGAKKSAALPKLSKPRLAARGVVPVRSQSNPIQPAVLKMLPGLPSGPANFYLDTLFRPELKFSALPAKAQTRLTQMTDAKAFRARLVAKPKPFVGVAEGDSWFDYLPAYFDLDFANGDLLGELNEDRHFHVFKVAKAGDTLENMVFGPNNTGAQLRRTLKAIADNGAQFFLFSGGGNDVAGPELERFLFPTAAAPDPDLPIRTDLVELVLGKTFTATFNHLIDEVKKVAPKIEIFLHGYDYAVPDGRAVINTPFGFHFVGPWLRPAFLNQGIKDPAVHQRVIDCLIDRLNQTLAAVAKKRAADGVHHINVRGTLVKAKPGYRKDWANELHATGRGWRKVADEFTRVMLGVLQP